MWSHSTNSYYDSQLFQPPTLWRGTESTVQFESKHNLYRGTVSLLVWTEWLLESETAFRFVQKPFITARYKCLLICWHTGSCYKCSYTEFASLLIGVRVAKNGTLRFFMTVRMHHGDSHRKDLREIWFFKTLTRICLQGLLRNVGTRLPNYTVSHPIRLKLNIYCSGGSWIAGTWIISHFNTQF